MPNHRRFLRGFSAIKRDYFKDLGIRPFINPGTVACITGTKPEFIRRLPDATGMETEVIIQQSHRYAQPGEAPIGRQAHSRSTEGRVV
jgi:hypothetical protein